jgi:pimeloyl-ACP methyl ester carboxylesterase
LRGVERTTVTTPSGRSLDVMIGGPEDGTVVLFHQGTPMAAALFEPWIEAGEQRGLRHVAYSRPGYADSSRHEGRSVADCTADVEAVAEALGFDRFHTIGWSGGGPHALACAAVLPDRVLSAATMAGVAPYGAPGFDFLEGMGQENIDEFGAALAGPDALRAYLESTAEAIRSVTGPAFIDMLGDLVTEVDRDALSAEFGDFVASGMGEALRNGIWGWFDDDIEFTRDWGFDIAAIHVPVSIWQGAEDRFVPFSHGKWLAANVGNATSRLLDGEGHMSLAINRYGAILDWLVENAAA